ncbi:MAG: hypothetical protein EAX89_05115 [Candidatus Lokiarchaeota archaeon]|nr:hypothetical protein [Candidatus Lokiarchaeota archaeon]
MRPQDSEFIKRAEQLEQQSKSAIKEKNYEKAISSLTIAKDIYTELGFTEKVGILIREIVQIKNLKKEEQQQSIPSASKQEFKIEFHPKETIEEDADINEQKGYEMLESARTQALGDNLKDALYFYDVAYKLFKKLNRDYECKQILWQINELKEFQRWGESRKFRGIKPTIKDIVSLAAAERRRLKIQSQLDPSNKAIERNVSNIKEEDLSPERRIPKLFEQMKKSEIEEQKLKERSRTLIELQKEQKKQEYFEKQEKLRLLREKKKQEDTFITQAQDLLDKGNKMLDKKNYADAKNYYRQSIELFAKLGWKNQVSILQNELKNIDRYKKEEENKQQHLILSKVESERQFQQTLAKALHDKDKVDQMQKERLSALPIEIKTILEKIELLKSKAAKEEELNNNSRAIARYEYILTLYRTISAEIINLSDDISIIETKIADLKAKL